MAKRKGAIQMSLGLIVAVVFAVILLSLMLSWLYGIFNPFEDITHTVTDIARQRLMSDLSSGDKRVGIAAPAITVWNKGETGSFALGISNDDPAQSTTYYVNVYLDQLGGDLAGQSIASYENGVQSWLTYSKTEVVSPGDSGATDIIIRPSTTADSGIYMLRAAICKVSQGSSCKVGVANPDTDLYGTDQFSIEIN